MKELIELNCIGMKFPRPIIEIAKIARNSPCSTLHVISDDFTFENDIKAWVETSNANLLKLEKDGYFVKVRIQFEN